MSKTFDKFFFRAFFNKLLNTKKAGDRQPAFKIL